MVALRILAAGSRTANFLYRQGFCIHINAFGNHVAHADLFIGHNELEHGPGHARFEVADVVNKIGAAEHRRMNRSGGFDSALDVQRLGVGTTGGGEHGQPRVLGHLGEGCAHQAQLRRSISVDRVLHIHYGLDAAHNNTRAGIDQLSNHHAEHRLGKRTHQLSGVGGGNGRAADTAGRIDLGDAVLGVVHDFVHSVKITQQR